MRVVLNVCFSLASNPDVCGVGEMLDVYHVIFHFKINKELDCGSSLASVLSDGQLSSGVRFITVPGLRL